MSYRYEPTASEKRAATVLRKAGWSVSEPACPECHGHGFVWEILTPGDRIFGSSSMRSCSQGCPMPMAFYPVMSVPA